MKPVKPNRIGRPVVDGFALACGSGNRRRRSGFYCLQVERRAATRKTVAGSRIGPEMASPANAASISRAIVWRVVSAAADDPCKRRGEYPSRQQRSSAVMSFLTPSVHSKPEGSGKRTAPTNHGTASLSAQIPAGRRSGRVSPRLFRAGRVALLPEDWPAQLSGAPTEARRSPHQ
jgi:hypothetical protein